MGKRTWAVSLFASAFCLFVANARADDSLVNTMFGSFGFHADAPKVSGDGCTVAMTLDEKSLLEKFPEAQTLGFLNSTLDQSAVMKEPNTIAMAFLFQLLPVAIKDAYDNNPSIDRCTFKASMTIVDDYGNEVSEPALSYGFNRAIYKKINWDNFQGLKLPRVALDFFLYPKLQATVSSEQAQ